MKKEAAAVPEMILVRDEGAFTTAARAAINNNFAALATAVGGEAPPPAGGSSWVAPPATAADPGAAGAVAYDTGYLYVCVATDTWMRVALETWTPVGRRK